MKLRARPRPRAEALLAAALVLGANVFARDAVEALRLRALRIAAAPTALVRRLVDPPAPRVATTDPAVTARRAVRREVFRDRDAAALPVVDHRPREGRLVVGAGRDAGVVFGAAVFAAEGILGHVDRVEAHLARVKLVSARGARTAVVAAETRSGLPGGLERVTAVFEGEGEDGVLADGALLEALRLGDRLLAFNEAASPLGEVAVPGARPRVRLFAKGGTSGAVAVVGVGPRAPTPELFEDEALAVALAPALAGRGALLIGAAARRLSPGAAVHAGGRYLGRVESAAGDVAWASRRDDPGRLVGVRLAAAGGETGATLRAEGGGVFRLTEGTLRAADGAEIAVFTAGGGGLVPPDLLVGRFVAERGGLRDPTGEAKWPGTVDASVFVFEDERRRLAEPRR
jgi:hypothetical protein